MAAFLPSDKQRIDTAEKYGLDPCGAKAVVFWWLDQGVPSGGVRYLGKKYLGLTTQTLGKYRFYYLKTRQGKARNN